MKRLIYTDQNAISQLRQTLQKKVVYFNYLLTQYHTFQKFHRVSTIEEAIELLNSPIKAFDKTIIESSNMPTLGGLSANVDAVSTIYGIKRENYIQALQNVKEKYSFNSSDAIKFEGGVFSIDLEKFNLLAEKYSVYAESPQQIALVDHWETLVKTMNNHVKNNWVSSFNAVQVAESFGVLYNRFTLVFELDYRKIADLIINL